MYCILAIGSILPYLAIIVGEVVRYIQKFVLEDLEKKMVFIGGPRQAGKTTLSKNILSKLPGGNEVGQYFNWDFLADRKLITKIDWAPSKKHVVFDEIHKFKGWKNWVKGQYDVHGQNHKFLITGSARLDLYRKGGDSLMGRYHYWRLHPFSLDEIPAGIKPTEALPRLLKFGGFPEPFLDASERASKRWRKERLEKIVRDDIRDLENIQSVGQLELLLELLRDRVGSSISYANLANDLQISPHTVKRWIEILNSMYVTFSVLPYSTNLARSVLKPPKIFFYDNGDVEGDDGVRLENLVANHLLKRLHFLEDYYGQNCQLRYLRDKEGREVDFVIVIDKKIDTLVEVKLSDSKISSSLSYYAEKLQPKHVVQIVANLKKSYLSGKVRILSPEEYFKPIWNL
jgi:uncharacterized protein